jgi:hypothetical protein
MTKKFDDKARCEYDKQSHPEIIYDGTTKVRDMVVSAITVKEARPYIAKHHYSQSMPDSTKYVFCGHLGDSLAGIVVYGMGAGKSQYQAILPDIKRGEYLELTRLWSPDSMPKNTESKLISESLKMLPKNIQLVISFADPSQGHMGYIYQASNFHYCGMSKGGKAIVTPDGQIQHSRLIGIYRSRHSELKDKSSSFIMDKYGWKYIKTSGKHRYIYLLYNKGKNKKLIKDMIKAYPKK